MPKESYDDPVVQEQPEVAAYDDPVVPENGEAASYTDPLAEEDSVGTGYTDPLAVDDDMPAEPETVLGKVLAIPGDIVRQGAAGVVRDLPTKYYRTLQTVAPGESPSPENPEGSGAAGFLGTATQWVEAADREALWSKPRLKGWWSVPGMAARSLAPNLLEGVATRGVSVALNPAMYGLSRAQEVYDRQRDRAILNGEEFDEGKAKLHAAGAALLEGGLEYVSNLFGMGKSVRAVGKGLSKGAAGAVSKVATGKLAKGISSGLRRLAAEMASEAGTEALQEGGGNLHEQLLGIADGIEKRPESLWGVNWEAVWDSAKYAAAAGALSAGTAHQIERATNRVRERQAARRITENAAWLKEQSEKGKDVRAAAVEVPHEADGLGKQDEELDVREDQGVVDAGKVEDEKAAADVEPKAEGDVGGGGTTAGQEADGALQIEVTPEMEAEAQRQAEVNARQDYRNKKRTVGRSASDELWANDPVRAAVIELGGIRWDGTEDQSKLPLQFRAKQGSGQSADQMLAELAGMEQVGERVSNWTTDDLIEHLQGNTREKAARFSDRQTSPQEREWLKRANTVATDNLALGFTFTVEGIPYRVEDIDDAGVVIVRTDGKDSGWQARLDDGNLMNIDGGSLRNGAGRAVKLRDRKDASGATDANAGYEDVPLDELVAEQEAVDVQTDEDVPFRADDSGSKTSPEMDKQSANEKGTKRVEPYSTTLRQVRFVRAGYNQTRQAADDRTYSRWNQKPLDLPELVEMAQDLTGGRAPRVVGRVNGRNTAAGSVIFRGETNAAGQAVFGRPDVITMLASTYRLISADEESEMREAAKTDAGGDEALEASLFEEAYMRELEGRVPNGPRFAMAVIAHEIGHIADQAARYGLVKPDRSKPGNGLNLLGRVAGLISWTRDIMADDPSGRTLTAAEVSRLQGIARKNAQPARRGKELMKALTDAWATLPELRDLPGKPELATLANARVMRNALEFMAATRPVLSEWLANATFQEQVRICADALAAIAKSKVTEQQRKSGATWFRDAFVRELEANRQLHLGKMKSELESLIAWWNGGDETMMNKYYQRSSEMFAEAFGVFLNNPAAVQKRAPSFFRGLMSYMDARPEMRDALMELNDIMESGPDGIMDHRERRLMDMFSKERRGAARERENIARRGRTSRLARDSANYMINSKSGPLWALIRAADALGLSDLSGRAAEWSDRVENIAGAERLWNTTMRHVGDILDAGGMDVQRFDAWAYLNMVARNPAYTQRGNPQGWHAQNAKDMIAYLRGKWGDARANTLDEALNSFQELWQQHIVPLLEGMYDEKTIANVKNNPVYFTLQVGMDDAEIKQFRDAVQNMDESRLIAFVQRSLNKTPFGERAGVPIMQRQGTHRPAMSLLGATMLKGTRIINDAYRNNLSIASRDLLEALKDPFYLHQQADEAMTDTQSQVVIRYMENGKRKAYYAPKFLGNYVRGDNPMSATNHMINVLRTYTLMNVWKRLQTVWSAAFAITQPISDAKTWNTLMPGVRTPIGNIARGHLIGGLSQMLPAATWYLPSSFFPPQSRERLMRPMRDLVREWRKTGYIDPRLQSLVQRGMSDLGGAFQGVSRSDPDAGEILKTFAGVSVPKALQVYAEDMNWYQRQWDKAKNIPAIGRLFSFTGRAYESMITGVETEALANKLSAMEYLDQKYPDMPERDKRKAVLQLAGNPNFAARAGADPFIDSFLQAFYNPWKEGAKAVVTAAKMDPSGFTMRVMWHNIMPTVLMWAAANGVLIQLARQMIPSAGNPEDDEDREGFLNALARWCQWMSRMPTYYNRRYINIPIMPVGEDSVLAVTIPQAQSLAPINGLITVALDELAQAAGKQTKDRLGIQRGMQSITSEVGVLTAFTSGNRSAVGQVIGPILEAMLTDRTNYFDPFYQRELLDRNEEALMRGGKWSLKALPAWQKYGKNAWNNAFGSIIGRFDTKTPRADAALKSDLQKIINAPGMSVTVGRMLRVIGGGEHERQQRMFSSEIQDRAYIAILAQRAALDMLKDPQHRFPEWAANKYINEPEFTASYNNFVTEHMTYSTMSSEDKAIYGKRNPVWQRLMMIQERLMRESK